MCRPSALVRIPQLHCWSTPLPERSWKHRVNSLSILLMVSASTVAQWRRWLWPAWTRPAKATRTRPGAGKGSKGVASPARLWRRCRRRPDWTWSCRRGNSCFGLMVSSKLPCVLYCARATVVVPTQASLLASESAPRLTRFPPVRGALTTAQELRCRAGDSSPAASDRAAEAGGAGGGGAITAGEE